MAGGPREIREIEHVWIPLADGTRLSARIWLPADAHADPVPAVLEYLPYRKDDCTAHGDALQHPYFAEHGYASVRVDLRGTGDSDGLLAGEYLAQEHDDALEVIAWLAAQPWCSGSVGMIGYSWGGFNGLQIAARRPPALKAIVTHASTDDRYRDDCHYMGGCLLGSDMLKWSTSMLTYPLQPPDPRFRPDDRREVWLDRLEHAPELARDWIAHQRYDGFWKHGSVFEDYAAIRCAVLAVGGWTDAYVNAVPRLLDNLSAPCRAIIGPWGHVMPHVGIPGPAIGFLQECVRWWDHWLKGLDTGVMADPPLRAFIEEWTVPAAFHATLPGRWIATSSIPARKSRFLLTSEGGLAEGGVGGVSARLELCGAQECGETAGVWCANGQHDEIATDQRPDDERSLVFDTPVLVEAVEVLGAPSVRLRCDADRPLALVSARLEDVAPTGEVLLVSWGLLNLAHRSSSEDPRPLEPGRPYDVELGLRACGYRFATGHRIRLALSPTYWPHAWPSPHPVCMGVHVGGPSSLEMPVCRADSDTAVSFEPPEHAEPYPHDERDGAERTRRITVEGGVHTITDRQSSSRVIPASGVLYRESGTDTYRITEGDPLSARVSCERTTSSVGAEDAWSVFVSAELTCDEHAFHVTETYGAAEGGATFFERTRHHDIPRDHM